MHVAKAAVQPAVDLPPTKMASCTHARNASKQLSRCAVTTRVVAAAGSLESREAPAFVGEGAPVTTLPCAPIAAFAPDVATAPAASVNRPFSSWQGLNLSITLDPVARAAGSLSSRCKFDAVWLRPRRPLALSRETKSVNSPRLRLVFVTTGGLGNLSSRPRLARARRRRRSARGRRSQGQRAWRRT